MRPKPDETVSVLTPLILLFLAAAPPSAMEPGAGWKAARSALTACLSVPAAEARGACLERAARELDAADARGEGPVPSPEALREARRREYGVRRAPSIFVPPRAPGERTDQLTTRLASASQNRDGAWIMRTAEGAVWAQTDGAYLVAPPHAGSSLAVRPGALGSFFCLIDGRREVRCKRRS